MNLAIRVDFGNIKFISYGHFFRIFKIYNFFKKKINFVFIVKYGDLSFFKKFFKGKILKIPNPKNFKTVFLYLKRNNINKILCDINSECSFINTAKPDFKIIGIKDNTKFLKYYDTIIFPHSYIKIKKKKEQTIYQGLKYIFFDKLFFKKKFKLKKKMSNLTVTIGGSDNLNLSKKIIDILIKKRLNIRLNLVIGPGYKKKISRYKNKNLKIYENVSNEKFLNIRLKSDFIITSGGQTLYENLFLNIPMICFDTNNHEKKIIDDFANKKFLIKGSFDKLKQIEKFIDYKSRKNLSNNTAKLNYKLTVYKILSKLLK